MDELVESANPEWFAWLLDQGLLPREELRKQLELFGTHILPRYRKQEEKKPLVRSSVGAALSSGPLRKKDKRYRYQTLRKRAAR
jgi:hypothetical protein